MRICEKIVSNILECKWFTHCGETNSIDGVKCLYVETLDDVNSKISSTKWVNAELDARGELSEFLCVNYKAIYQKWNLLVEQAKCNVLPCVKEKIIAQLNRIGLPHAVYTRIEYDIVMIIVALSYSEYFKSNFHYNLLKIYMSGHIPCGWSGKYPKGTFEVF